MSQPLAFFITWTTYGTWLPGDARGWIKTGQSGIQHPDERLEEDKFANMRGSPVILTPDHRRIVDEVIRKHCEIRRCELHALNVRTNHVHVVVSADERPERVMEQFKAWASRRLNEHSPTNTSTITHREWWTEHGSTRWINNEEGLCGAIEYVLERQ